MEVFLSFGHRHRGVMVLIANYTVSLPAQKSFTLQGTTRNNFESFLFSVLTYKQRLLPSNFQHKRLFDSNLSKWLPH